jgi:hypothetical protein
MNRQLPIIIAIGLSSAVLYASALSGVAIGLLVTYLAQLPLFVIGLSLGVRAAALAGGAGMIALTVIGGTMPGLLYALSTALPVALLVGLALRKRVWTDGIEYWYPPGNLLLGTAAWCAILVIIAAVVLGVFGIGFQASVASFVSGISEVIAQGTGQSAPAAAIEGMAGVLPGITAWSWMLMATINGLLAQALVTRMGKNLRPGMRMADVNVPLTWASMFGVSVALAFVLPADIGFTVANLAIVLAYPLLLQGLSVVHTAMASYGAWTIGYVAFYVVMIFFGWLSLAVVALGMAEPVLKLRERLMRPKST